MHQEYPPWFPKLLRFHEWLFTALNAARKQWHPTPTLLPGKPYGRRSLVGCSPWGHKELDTTERLHFTSSGFTHVILCARISLRLNNIPLYAFKVLHFVYPWICPWTFELLSPFSLLLWITLPWTWVFRYLFETLLSIILGVYTQQWNCGLKRILCLMF